MLIPSETETQQNTIKEKLIKFFSPQFIFFERKNNKRFFINASPQLRDSYSKELADCGNEAMKLLVAYKQAKLAVTGSVWNCEVVFYEDLSKHLNDLLMVDLESSNTYQKHFIIQAMSHFINLDVEVKTTATGNVLSIIVFDAAKAWQYQLALLPSLIKAKEKHTSISNLYFTNDDIQKDEVSCAIMAFSIAKQIRKIENFHQLIREISDAHGEILWMNMPNSFLKYAQSFSFLQSLNDKKMLPCNKKDQKLIDYAISHKGFFSNAKPKKARNFASLDAYKKYSEKLLKLIKSLSEEELQQIIDGKKTITFDTTQETTSSIPLI